MSNTSDPNSTAAAPDPHSSASRNGDETAAMSSAGRAPAGPRFGPPAATGEVGVLGPYRVLKELGKGGMGAVYLALDTRLDRKLAMKVMLPEFAADADAKERFLREARAAAKVSHDNVVTVYEADERDDVPYITMQLLQGYPLDEYLKQKGAPPLPHVVRIGLQTALGLAAAHAQGLVHRDIKPANLWLEAPNGRVKVLDFGLAKPVGSQSELTKSGAIVGTPAYMSPEQARGQKLDARTDLFSLGAVLYRLCAGKNPFAGDHVMAVLAALITDEPTPIRELNPIVSEPLAELIHQMLAKQPEDRTQTAAEVAKRLRAIMDQQSGRAVAEAPAARAATDISTSQPVVLDPKPHQPPLVSPMQISAAPVSAFADLGADDATEVDAATAPKPVRKMTGVWIGAGVAVVLAAVAGGLLITKLNKDGKTEPVAEGKGPIAPKGEGKGKTVTPAPKVTPPVTPATPPGPFKNGIGMEFVRVPKGTGWLGGGGGKPGETKVEFQADFYLGKYEVTQEEWEKVMGSNPSHFSRTGPGKNAVKDIPDADLKRFPVESVSWDDCQLFIQKLNEREKDSGWVYRLPTETEWEYSCRGGPIDRSDSGYDFYSPRPSNTLLLEQANFAPVAGQGLQRTSTVGAYAANALGLYGMHGNVWEWCNASEQALEGASHRVHRGGCLADDSGGCRTVHRGARPPSNRDFHLGLRLARVPSAGPPQPTFANGIGMEFVKVPKGTGWLGGGGGKPGGRKVEFKADFYLGKYEVTQEEWEKVTGLNPSDVKRGSDAVKGVPDADLKRFPVEQVSWDDCQVFIERLNKKEKDSGWEYRLPTEAEWEYACRGGPVDKADSAFDFYFTKPTNTLLPEQANFAPRVGTGLMRTCKVGSYEPNFLRLYDMHGNVLEWCSDAEKGADGDSLRVGRGGGYNLYPMQCQAANRIAAPPSYRSGNLGLRLARVPLAAGGK